MSENNQTDIKQLIDIIDMDRQLITQQLTTWMIDFVEKPNPLLNGWAPCPYARQARVNDKLVIKFSKADQSLLSTVEQSLPLLENAFKRVAPLEGELETKHKSFNQFADNLQHAYYRDWPDQFDK